ncbi:hypothetical protein [Geobacter sp.]|uniref:hypothetical protein n=1 Tax=Geobacter sp. TaxID=46610 RepID=UPI00262BB6E3|nr:hypothetical protein [Geobacter sp.]
MSPPFSVRYQEPWADGRYIHKYYLPLDLKRMVCPADIDAIERSVTDNDQHGLWEGIVPAEVSGCTIYYKDLRLEKRVECDVTRRVLLACAEYYKDCRAELAPEEIRAALALNELLAGWEKSFRDECVRLTEEMEQRLRSGDPFLTDYEIETEIYFYLQEDDPFSDNQAASKDDWDRDTSLICTIKDSLRGKITAAEAADPDYYGIGDDQDHNDCYALTDNPVCQVRHCATFHELYDHLRIPFKHMGRIGMIWSDIKVWHQNAIDIDVRLSRPRQQKVAPLRL